MKNKTKSIESLEKENTFLKEKIKTLEDQSLEKNLLRSQITDEEQLKLLFEFAPDAYYITDLKGNFLDGNKAAVDMIGYEKKDLFGKNIFSQNLISQLDQDRLASLFAKSALGKPTGPDEFTVLHKSGKKIIVEVRTFPITINEQNLILRIACDVTVRRNAEKLLQENEQNLRSLIEYTDAIPWKQDIVSGRFTYVGNQIEKKLGFPVQNWTDNKFWLSRVYREDRERVSAIRERAALQGKNHIIEYRMYSSKREIIWVKDIVTVFEEDNKPKDFIGFMFDITDHKIAENRLKFTEESVRSLINASNNRAMLIAVDGTIIEINQQSEELFGLSSRELLGKNILQFLPSKIKRSLRKHAERIILTGVEDRFEFDYENSFYDITLNPLFDNNGIVDRLAVFAVDITYKKKADAAIKKYVFKVEEHKKLLETKSHELIVLNRELSKKETLLKNEILNKDKFLSIISHDLRSPFSALLGLVNLLQSNLDDYSKTEIEDAIEVIKNSAKKAFDLTDDLLQWAKTQSGTLGFLPTSQNLKNLTDDILNSILGLTEVKNISVENKIENSTIANIDLNMISTVLRNLLMNAIKFSSDSSSIIISSDQDNKYFYISVEDKGIGMTDDECNYIFDDSVHFSSPGTKGEKGTGLGLILCKELIEFHGGTIDVKSKKDYGTTFTFSIPK